MEDGLIKKWMKSNCVEKFDIHAEFEKKTGLLKFMFSKKATKLDKIFTTDLTLCSKRQIDG